MTADFGVRRPVKDAPVLAIAVAVVLAVIGGAMWANYAGQRPHHMADYAAYQVEGHPCAEVTPQVFQSQEARATQSFSYDDISLARAFGHAECTELASHEGRGLATYPACKFTAPGLLAVTSAKTGPHYFIAPVGHAMVIAFPKTGMICQEGMSTATISD